MTSAVRDARGILSCRLWPHPSNCGHTHLVDKSCLWFMRVVILISILFLSAGCGEDRPPQEESAVPVPVDSNQFEPQAGEGSPDQANSSSIPSWVPVEVVSAVIPEQYTGEEHLAAEPAQIEAEFQALHDALSELRDEYAPLRSGDFQVLSADEQRRIFVFSRTLDEETVVVALSASEEAHSIRVELPAGLRKNYHTVYSTHDEGYRVQQDARALLLEMNGQSALVLRGASE